MDSLLVLIRIIVFLIACFTLYYIVKASGKYFYRMLKDLFFWTLTLPVRIVKTISMIGKGRGGWLQLIRLRFHR